MSTNVRGFFYIQQVERMVQQCLEAVLLPYGLTAGQYLVLSLLMRHEPISSADLARLSRKTAQSTGEFVKGLELRGLVQRHESPASRRVLLVSITPEGRDLFERCDAAVILAEREFFSCLQSEELEHLGGLLRRVRKHISEQADAS